MYNSPLKWVGSKQSILDKLLPYIGSPNTFVEPFIGSATVSLNVSANEYIMNDMNYDLINLYIHALNTPSNLKYLASSYFIDVDDERYYELRNKFNSEPCDSLIRAALFLTLNKFAFNGVCRYNKNGLFNVPYGKSTKRTFPDKELTNFVNHFSNKSCTFTHGDFTNPDLYDGLGDNDVVYFDPPYLPADEFDSNFTAYTKEDFTPEQHQKIVDISISLRDKGVICLVSNHYTDKTKNLYKDATDLVLIPKQRLLSASNNSRKVINEVLAVYGNPTIKGRLF